MYEIDDREHEGIKRLISQRFLLENLFSELKLQNSYWAILQLQLHHFDKNEQGDIDILLGNWELNSDGTWMPSFNYLVGLEAKCCYYSQEENSFKGKSLKNNSPKDTQKRTKQLLRLKNLGLNKVGLVDLIAIQSNNDAANGPGQDWLLAGSNAKHCLDAFNTEILKNPRFVDFNNLFGHWIFSWGSIPHKTENEAGSPTSQIIKPFSELSLSTVGKIKREILEKHLLELLGPFQKQLYFGHPPLVFIDCIKCEKLHPYFEKCPNN